MRQLLKRVLAATGYKLERTRPRHSQVGHSSAVGLAALENADDMGFRVGDWRYQVPVSELVGRPCFGYAPESWHPFVAEARELIAEPSVRFEESVLRRHFEGWQPRSIAEAHFPGGAGSDPVLGRIPSISLFEPWLKRPPPCDDPLNRDCRPPGSPLFGPVDVETTRQAFVRLRKMLRSIASFGYQPDAFPRGLIKVVVLRHDDRQRYLVGHGQHRAAILSALGHEMIEVGIHRDLPVVIDSRDAHRWPHVASGLITIQTAIKQLARYFPPDRDHDPALSVERIVLANSPI